MADRFDYFVIFAGMRTGSNYLERNLNAAPDIHCAGELFNPYFIAQEGRTEFRGITLAAREAQPMDLIDRLRAEGHGLPGFRLFHDHDPRVRAAALRDPRAAKIVLTRNPLDSFVSWQRALASNQWVLTDAKGEVAVPPIDFDAEAFEAFLADQSTYLAEIRRGLAQAGQTAFNLRYEDLRDVQMINGALTYLGSRHRLSRTDQSLKRQNTAPLSETVADLAKVRAAVAALDPFGMDHVSQAEPSRGPAVPSFVACPKSALLYLPMGGPEPDPVLEWMAALDGVERTDLICNMRQKDLRKWRQEHPEARSFTVLHHPLARAYAAFVSQVLPSDLQANAEFRHGLITSYKVPLPEVYPSPEVRQEDIGRAFVRFLKFLKANLAGQTSLRIDAAWAGQMTILQGMAQVALPDRMLRAGPELTRDLNVLAGDLGYAAPEITVGYDAGDLRSIYDPAMEKAARAAYARDYTALVFGDWCSETVTP